MWDIRDGRLQITNLDRVEQVRLRQCRLSEKRRNRDSFVYILDGKVDYDLSDGRRFSLTGGQVYYLPLNCAYSMQVHSEGLHYIVCNFLCPQEEPRQSFYFTAQNPQAYEKLFRELALQFSAEGPDRMAQSMAVLYQIYGRIVREHHPSYVSGAAKKKISQAKDYILQNLSDQEMSVKQLAEWAKMSQVHFRRLFHAMYGTSPTKYITAARVRKAKSLLGLSEMGLEDVASRRDFPRWPIFAQCSKPPPA